MRYFFALATWFLLTGICNAATAAWKIPIESLATDYRTNNQIRKLEKAPATSAFFQPGDELWDLSGVLPWHREEDDPFAPEPSPEAAPLWTGDWIVWNGRSEQVIAKGSWQELRQAEEALGYSSIPMVSRSKFELVVGGKDNRSLSLASRYGDEARAAIQGTDLKVICTEYTGGLTVVKLQLGWKTPGVDFTWGVNTTISMRDGERMLIARHGAGEEKWELFGSMDLETFDGVPAGERRWLEYPDGTGPWRPYIPSHDPSLQLLEEGLILGIYPVPVDFLELMGAEEEAPATTAIPPAVQKLTQGLLLDARKVLEKNGLRIEGTGTFAGFDPKGRLVIVADAKSHDLARQITASCCGTPPASVFIESNIEAGGWGLACNSGEKASITRTFPGSGDSGFRIEPTFANRNQLVDFRYAVDLMAGSKVLGRNESTTTLSVGKAHRAGNFQVEGAAAVDLILTARNPASR